MRNFIHTLILFVCVLGLASCGSSKRVVKETKEVETFNSARLLEQAKYNLIDQEFITAKMKFNLRSQGQNLSVGGSLKMKKDDVIQLSLVAFGFVEAARIELTRDEVLVVDRINRRYIRAPYAQLSFLKDAELDFFGLQSLFRNELFVPGKRSMVGNESVFSGSRSSDGNAVFAYQNNKLKFQFLVTLASALVQQVKVGAAKGRDDTSFSWDYDNFQNFNGRQFPIRHKIVLSGEKGFEADMTLSNLGNDSKWETRTSVKDSYTRLDAVTMITRLLQMN